MLSKYLVDKKFLHINDKKLITYNAKDSAFVTTKGMVNKNMLSLSHFIYKVFNQIRIINQIKKIRTNITEYIAGYKKDFQNSNSFFQFFKVNWIIYLKLHNIIYIF